MSMMNNSIFTKQEESLLAGLGFTFQPIKRTTNNKSAGSGSSLSSSNNCIYKLYEDLISKQAFSHGNLQILFRIVKECVEVIDDRLVKEEKDSGSGDKEVLEDVDLNGWDFEEYLLLVFVLLSFYINQNYVGPPLHQTLIPEELKTWFNVQEELAKSTVSHEFTQELTTTTPVTVQNSFVLDGEDIVENIKFPIILVIVEKVLDHVHNSFVKKDTTETQSSYSSNCGLILWWKIRTWFLHQQFLEERSQELFKCITKAEKEFLLVVANIEQEQEIKLQAPLQAMFYVEMSEIYLYFYDIEKAKHLIELAKNAAEIKAYPAGVLGRRTKFQQTDLAQLILHVELTTDNYKKPFQLQPIDKSIFPQNVLLEDDVRLEQIQVSESDTEKINTDLSAGHLTPLQHLVILADFRAKSKYLPNDGIYHEELMAYLQFLIEHPKLWCVQFLALFKRSLLETDQRRTVERSMSQLQSLKFSVETKTPLIQERMKCFFGSGLPFYWEVEHGLGKVLTSLGLYKEALDISLRLSNWEDVITCYNLLNLRHKAEEIIRDELEKNSESVKLWIYLGDATDNLEYYEKAWNLSKCRSSRAQRQWGNYYFARKKFEESIEHYELSVQLNPLENATWIRLGYSSIQCEKWELGVKAYQHATELDGDNFELWNNLANAFLKSGNKTKALRAFHEAIKCNYESWKVWENLLVVATDCKVFDDVIRAYNRLLDLKTKWEDEQVLTLLVQGIVMDLEDHSGVPSKGKYLKDTLKLFGRITASVRGNPTIWKLYSDLQAVSGTEAKNNTSTESIEDVPETHLYNSAAYMERAIKCSIIDPNWNKVEPKINMTSELVLQYMERVHEFQQFQMNSSNPGSSEQLKVDAQFLVKKVFNAIKQTHQTAINPVPFEEILKKLQDGIQTLGFCIE